MKIAMLSGAVAAVAIGGCVTAPPDPNERVVVDQQKIELVESWARAKGVTVIWMNTPMRTVRDAPVQVKAAPTSGS